MSDEYRAAELEFKRACGRMLEKIGDAVAEEGAIGRNTQRTIKRVEDASEELRQSASDLKQALIEARQD